VKDPSGAVIAGANVEIRNPVSGYTRTAQTGTDGTFRFSNVPFNPYHLVVSEAGFTTSTQDVDVRSSVPAVEQITLQLGAAAATSVTVEASGGDLVENDSTFHTDVDRALFDKLPLQSTSSVSSLVTLTTPGVAADSNGLFHGLGDHASNSFSIDGQPITDQQSKVFSNQIPEDSIQSLEVISGAPPAEFGGKTSLVIVVTTRSGLGVNPPHGQVTSSYGSFGSVNGGFDLAYGGDKWGNYISGNGLNTARFLDGPELAKGYPQSQFRLQPLLVSDAQFLRRGERNGMDVSLGDPSLSSGADRFVRRAGTERGTGWTAGSALEDRHIQHCALVDAADQFHDGAHYGCFCAARWI
jgi:hypothetical protein